MMRLALLALLVLRLHRAALVARSLSALCSTLAIAGCADADGRFREFEQRRRAQNDAGQAGAAGADAGSAGATGCAPPAPNVVSGPAVLALETTMSPGVAILFRGRIETPEVDGRTGVKYTYRALDATDRVTEVGDELVVGPYAIEADGSFLAPTPLSTIPGPANAILPGVPITSELTLHGSICGIEQFYCGTVSGEVVSPFAGPASGNFGITLLGDTGELPERPRFGCADDALAPPLAD